MQIENFLYSSWIELVNQKIDEINLKGGVIPESYILLKRHINELESSLDYLKKELTIKKK